MIEKIRKTREYLDYLKEHYNNVQKAWKELQEKCKDMKFIYDDFLFWEIDTEISRHDDSKMSIQEFVPYRIKFFPTDSEVSGKEFEEAWDHHKKHNNHHWQTWVERDYKNDNLWTIAIVHNVIDWVAMGYKFNDTAQDYYEKNKDQIKIPEQAEHYIYEIFSRLYPEKG
jgi:hypothetical protein